MKKSKDGLSMATKLMLYMLIAMSTAIKVADDGGAGVSLEEMVISENPSGAMRPRVVIDEEELD